MNENQISVAKYTSRVFRGVRYPVIPTVYDDALSYYEAIGKLAEAVNEALQYLYGLADTITDETNAYTDQQVALLKSELEKQISGVDSKYEGLYNDIVNANLELTIKVNQLYSAWNQYQGMIDSKLDAMMQSLKQYIDSLVLGNNIYVINPVSGMMSTVQVALNDIWLNSNYGALTAWEYDSMDLTAAEYDAKGITAWDYDHRARWIFFERLYLRMRSPFDGVLRTYSHVINELADLHKKALTAEGYDVLGLTAQIYDGKGLTAYQFDWNGETLLAA